MRMIGANELLVGFPGIGRVGDGCLGMDPMSSSRESDVPRSGLIWISPWSVTWISGVVSWLPIVSSARSKKAEYEPRSWAYSTWVLGSWAGWFEGCGGWIRSGARVGATGC